MELPELPMDHPAAEDAHRLMYALTYRVRCEEEYRSLPQRDRYLWDVSWLEKEVMNGGIDQYFWNHTGNHWAECLDALDAIGCKKSCEMLRSACDLFPGRHPSIVEEVRQEQRRAITGEQKLDDMVSGDFEFDLFQRLLDYYHSADPTAK
jgi:hypothetical protein